jgi:mutator protein MutT
MGVIIRVAAGILTCGSRLLICQRRPTDLHALQWEFPGGKANEGESDSDCLRRELREELHIEAVIGEILDRTSHNYPNGRTVALAFIHVPEYTGEIVNTQFQALVWARPNDLPSYNFLEGDRDFVTRLARGKWDHLFALPHSER